MKVIVRPISNEELAKFEAIAFASAQCRAQAEFEHKNLDEMPVGLVNVVLLPDTMLAILNRIKEADGSPLIQYEDPRVPDNN